jgi:hypothetical protein
LSAGGGRSSRVAELRCGMMARPRPRPDGAGRGRGLTCSDTARIRSPRRSGSRQSAVAHRRRGGGAAIAVPRDALRAAPRRERTPRSFPPRHRRSPLSRCETTTTIVPRMVQFQDADSPRARVPASGAARLGGRPRPHAPAVAGGCRCALLGGPTSIVGGSREAKYRALLAVAQAANSHRDPTSVLEAVGEWSRGTRPDRSDGRRHPRA